MVFYQLTDSIQWPTRQGLWLSLTGFFYLCTNQTRHASDLSALCRVFFYIFAPTVPERIPLELRTS